MNGRTHSRAFYRRARTIWEILASQQTRCKRLWLLCLRLYSTIPDIQRDKASFQYWSSIHGFGPEQQKRAWLKRGLYWITFEVSLKLCKCNVLMNKKCFNKLPVLSAFTRCNLVTQLCVGVLIRLTIVTRSCLPPPYYKTCLQTINYYSPARRSPYIDPLLDNIILLDLLVCYHK